MKRGILLLAIFAAFSISAVEFDTSFSSQSPVWPLRLVDDQRGYIVSGWTNDSQPGSTEWRLFPWIGRLPDDGQLDRFFRARHLTRKGTFDPKIVFRLSNGLVAVQRSIPADKTNKVNEIVYLNQFGRVKRRIPLTSAFQSPPTHPRADLSIDPFSAVMRSDGSIAYWCEEEQTRGVRIISPDGALTTNWLGRSGRVFSRPSGHHWNIYNLRVSADDVVSWTQEAVGGYLAYNYAVAKGTNPVPSGKWFEGSANARIHTVSSDGVLYIGGSGRYGWMGRPESPFYDPSGRSVPFLRRYTLAGVDTNFVPAFPPEYAQGRILDTVVQKDGKILFAGYFNDTNSTAFRFIGRLNANGTWDSTFQNPELLGGIAHRIHIDRHGRILLVGDFFRRDVPGQSLTLIRLLND